MIPETWLALSHSSLSFSLSFPLYTCVTAETLTQMRGTAQTPSPGFQPASCPALMLTRLANCSNPRQAPPCAPVSSLTAGPAFPSHLSRSSVTFLPKLFPTGPGMSRADSSKEVRIKSFVSKAVLWQGVSAFCSRRILLLLEKHQAVHKVSCIPWEPWQENLETDVTFLSEASAVAPQPQNDWGSENNCVSRTGATHRGLHRPLQGKSLCSSLPAGLST